MKKNIFPSFVLLPIFLFIFQLSLAQQQEVLKPPLTKEDYLKKSKRQKTAAWVLMSTGVALTLVSLGDAVASSVDATSTNSKNDGSVLSALALGSLAGGTYFFIASGKNKRRAANASVFIDIMKTPVLQQASISNVRYPGLGMRISW